MIGRGVLAIGCKEVDEFFAFGFGEAGAGAYMLEFACVVEEAEEKGAEEGVFAAFVPAEAGYDAVAIALVLDFEHGALVWFVGACGGLGHDTVEACAFEAAEPVFGLRAVGGRGSDVDWGFGAGEDLFEAGAAIGEGVGSEVFVFQGEEVEEDDGGWSLAGEEIDAAGCWVDALGEGVEVEAIGAGDDDLAVEDAAWRELGEERGAEFGEVAVEGLAVARLEEEVVAVAEDEGAKAVPFGLEEPVAFAGDGVHALGEHGEDWGF